MTLLEWLHSGFSEHSHGQSPILMVLWGKMVIFHGYCSLPEGRWPFKWLLVTVFNHLLLMAVKIRRENQLRLVTVGSLSHFSQGFIHSNGAWEWDFFHHPQDRRSSHGSTHFPRFSRGHESRLHLLKAQAWVPWWVETWNIIVKLEDFL